MDHMIEKSKQVAPIFIDQLHKQYRGKKRKIVNALQGISLTVAPGEVFGFLGPNGAGKSTTIKSLLGLIRPTSGVVELFGQPAGKAKARVNIGYLPENPAFYDFLSAREYLSFVGRSFGMSSDEIKSESQRVLSLLDLVEAEKRPIRSYSKGMVQRLGIAQTMLHDPDLYILDEPMSGLDPLGRTLVKDLILDLKQRGKTVSFSTHVTADAERVCDRIGVIIDGILHKEQVVSELLREGVDGYFCRVVSDDQHLLDQFSAEQCGGGVSEIFVRRDQFDEFSASLLSSGGSFDLVEPRRRDIEDYFLALVEKYKGS